MSTFGPSYELPGNLSAAGLAHELVFGTPVAPTQLAPFDDFTLEPPDTGLFFPETAMGVRETEVFPLYGQVKLTGSLGSPLFPVNGILAWIAAVGCDGSQSGTAAGTAKNGTITAAAAGVTSLTYTVTGGTPAPVNGDYLQIGPGIVTKFGVLGFGTLATPSFVVKVTGVALTGPYTLTVAATPFAVTSSNNVAQACVAPFYHSVIPMNRPISLTAERNLGGYQSQQYAGCMVDSFDLTLPTTNAAASFKANLSASTVAVLNTPTAVESLTDPAVPFVFAEGALSVFGQALNNVTNVKFTLNNGVKENRTVAASHLPTFITPTSRILSGELTTVFYSLNDANYGFFENWHPNLSTPVPGALSLTLAHPGTGGSFYITLPSVSIEKVGTASKIGDLIMQTLSYKAAYNLTDNYSLQSYFTNTAYAPF